MLPLKYIHSYNYHFALIPAVNPNNTFVHTFERSFARHLVNQFLLQVNTNFRIFILSGTIMDSKFSILLLCI